MTKKTNNYKFIVMKIGHDEPEVVGPYITLREAQAKAKELSNERNTEFQTFVIFLLTREGLTEEVQKQYKSFKRQKK